MRSEVMKLAGANGRLSPWATHTRPPISSRRPITINAMRTQESSHELGLAIGRRSGTIPRVEAASCGAISLTPSTPLTASNASAWGSGKIPGAGVEQRPRTVQSQLGGVYVTYTDQVITCSDCGIDFVFSASEQEFFAEKGFASAPKRCSSCRAQRRASGGGNSYGGGGGYGGGG